MDNAIRRRGAVAAALVSLAIGTVAASGPALAVDSPAEVSAVPIPAGQVEAAVAQLDGIAAEYMRRSGVPGMSIAVVHNDAVVYAKGFGVRSVDTGAPVDENTVFQVASLSKPVGATVVARAVGQGRVKWDDRVVRYLPWFALKDRDTTRQVTIADLYSHRSGLPLHAGDLLEDLGYSRAQVLRRLRHVPLAPIRAEYAYTNFGLTAAAEAVAGAAGTSWPNLSRRTLYRPLGMTSTSSRYRDYLRASNRAVLHVPTTNGWAARYRRNPEAQSPAGGVSSTAADMARWMRLQLADGAFEGRRLVASGALTAMRTPHSVSNPPATPASRSSFYGLGIGIGDDAAGRVRFSHSGAFFLGASTRVIMLPSENLGIVVLTNGSPVGLPEAVGATFMDLAEFGRVERDWLTGFAALFAASLENPSRLAGRRRPDDPRPARRASAYVGTYANSYFGSARIVRRAGRLTMLLGPKNQAYRLRHWNGDTFSYRPRGENALGITAVTFRAARDGRAASFLVENLDEEGLGRFTRR